jgi:hypothetical protein
MRHQHLGGPVEIDDWARRQVIVDRIAGPGVPTDRT